MAVRSMPLTLTAYGLSDKGLVRKNNEDIWGSLQGHKLWIVADGMGGHQAGEVASREATLFIESYLKKYFEENSLRHPALEELSEKIRASIEDANKFVYELSKSHDLLQGMGTTICCLCFLDDSVIFAHVGDSRIYRLRNKKLQQLTSDHSLMRELIDLGRMTEKQAENFIYKNIITRAIGTEPEVEVSVESTQVLVNDLFILCTDGLSDLLTQDQIEEVLNKPFTIEERVRYLIAEAKSMGGNDNITVVAVDVKETNAKEDLS